MSREQNSGRRPYRQKQRARQQEQTRQRITEAVVELHRTVGPAQTTISEVADIAGVGRMTVYKHFPNEIDLFEACNAHWSAEHPFPVFEDCLRMKDIEERWTTALTRLYAFYANGADMLGNIMRDAPHLPALQKVLAANWIPAMQNLEDGLMPRGLTALEKKRARAAIRVALDLGNWERLRETGLSDSQAVKLAVEFIAAAMDKR